MGASYGAIAIRTTDVVAIEDQMRLLGRACAIASSGEYVVVADAKIDEQYSDWLRALTTKLSAAAGTAALGSMVHDDDVLLLVLADSGQEKTIYSSTDVMLDFLDEAEPGEANIEAFKTAFDIDDNAIDRLRAVLTTSGTNFESPYVLESDRHRDLCAVLNLPEWVVFFSYSGLKDYPPESFQNAFLAHYGVFPSTG